jgi:hypothetical protein
MLKRMIMMAAIGLTCWGDDDETTRYQVDGVAIVLEEGVGPEEPEMVLAAELFRREAETYWQLELDAEQALWRSIRAIRWIDEAVPADAGYQNTEIIVEWNGCAVTGRLYPLLTQHYRGEGVTADDRTWARNLAGQSSYICQ